MTPVIASTKSDSLKMESAGVEIGEKMLVELEDWAAGCAKMLATGQKRLTRICSARLMCVLFHFRICIRQFLLRSARPGQQLSVFNHVLGLHSA
jgi:hypothetical protein